MTKFPVLGVLVAVIFLSSAPIRGQADAAGSYGDKGSVGFTGKMPEKPTPPPVVTLPSAEKEQITLSSPTAPNNGGRQIVTLPATGDTSNKVFFVTASLITVFIFILIEKIIKNKNLQNLKL